MNLADLYNAGNSIMDIARITETNYDWVRRRLVKDNVKMRTNAESVHLAKGHQDVTVSEDMIEYIDGLLLGDATISNPNNFAASFSISQSGHRRPWIDTISKTFDRFGLKYSIGYKLGGPCVIKGKNCVRKPSTYIKTLSYPWFKAQRMRWYADDGLGKKIVPTDVRLTPLSIAQWMMGDGSTSTPNDVNEGRQKVTFHSDGFTSDDIDFLRLRLQELYGWDTKRTSRNQIGLYRVADKGSLALMIEPFMDECFRYKIPVHVKDRRVSVTPEIFTKIQNLWGTGKGYHLISKSTGICKQQIGVIVKREGWVKGKLVSGSNR